MRFIGAFLWALGDPDKPRTVNVFHFLSGTVEKTPSALRPLLVTFLPLFGVAGFWLIELALNKYYLGGDALSSLVAGGLASTGVIMGFLKVCVASIVEDQNIAARLVREAAWVMLVFGLYIYLL